MGHVLEHVALGLQRLAGGSVTRGKTRKTDEQGIYNVVYHEKPLTRISVDGPLPEVLAGRVQRPVAVLSWRLRYHARHPGAERGPVAKHDEGWT